MHPPWINFHFSLFLFTISHIVLANAEQNESDNSTISRMQRETYERERRLIPYMTYYITQRLTSPNSEPRQNIFVPVIASRESVYQYEAVPKVPTNHVQSVNHQPNDFLPKPVLRIQNLQSPSFVSSPIQQTATYNSKDAGVLHQFYETGNQYTENGPVRPQIQPPEVQSATQPIQLIKVNAVPINGDQKHGGPQIIKVIPVVAKLPTEDRAPRTFAFQQPHYAYARTKVQTLLPEPYSLNDPNYYKAPLLPHRENSFQKHKIYASHIPVKTPQFRLVEPLIESDRNTYPITKIVLSSTVTPPTYTQVEFNGKGTLNDAHFETKHSTQFKPHQGGYGRERIEPASPSEKHLTVGPGRQQVFGLHPEKEIGHQNPPPQHLFQSQSPTPLPRLRVPEEEKIRFVATVTPVSVTNDLESERLKIQKEGPGKNNQEDRLLNSNLFSLLKETDKLPQNLTPDNIDSGIKTLALILERLQQQKHYFNGEKISVSDSSASKQSDEMIKSDHEDHPKKVHNFPEKSGTSTPGKPGIDYPIYSSIPQTNFDCSTQRYKGFFGDPDTKCQVWHYCDLNGGQASFLCPNGTIFSQVALTCDWWFNVKCASTSQLYVLNERLYKYILPFSPSFPEDFSGPVVDTYLTAKFKEMESKSKSKALKSPTNSTTTVKPEMTTEPSADATTEFEGDFQTTSSQV